MSKLVSTTQRILKRVDRGLSGPIVEFSEQFLYGHREILVNYAGLDPKAMIKGSIEHGWALDSGKGIRKFLTGRYLYLSWSEQRIRRSNIDDPMTLAIGAPFIYAHSCVQEQIEEYRNLKKDRMKETLFFPVHGTEFSQQNAESQVELFREFYDPQLSTVCLYWIEYVNPQIYGYYKKAGFNILCAGFSGQMEHTGLGYSARKLAGSPIGGRPNFLLNTIAIFSNFDNIVFGGVGTGLFYAAYMKKNITLLHKYLKSSYLDMDYEWGNSFENNIDEMRYVNYIAEQLGCSFSDIDYNSEKFHQLAEVELGTSSRKSPEALREILTPHLTYVANPQSLIVHQKSIGNFNQLLESYSQNGKS
jgi:hypothetical protein